MISTTSFQLPDDFLARTIAANPHSPPDVHLQTILKYAAEWSAAPAEQWSDEAVVAAGDLKMPSVQSDRQSELLQLQQQRELADEEQAELADAMDLGWVAQFLKAHGANQAFHRGLQLRSIEFPDIFKTKIMTEPTLLRITGEVSSPRELTFADLSAINAQYQIADVSALAGGRKGTAITLEGLLQIAGAKSSAKYLGLHAAADNFHASIPLDGVRAKAFLIYALEGQPLSTKAGGPCRFFVPDHLACRSAEIDECANVKFVDTLELTPAKGDDNRPHDDAAHAALHASETPHEH